jgi:hypothetical protein
LRLASVTLPFRRPTRIASAPFRVGHKPYPAGYGFPWPFGSRHSLLDPSLSRWGSGPSSQSAYCHSPKLLSDRPHRGLHVPHEGDVCAVGVGASYTPRSTVFMPEPITNSGPNATSHHRLNQAFDDLLLFRRVDEDSLVHSPVRTSPDPVCPPGSGSPWISPAASHRSLPILHAPDGDGIEHYPGSVL